MGFVSVVGARRHDDRRADPNLLGGSPLWGYAARRERRHPRRQRPGRSPAGVVGMLAVGSLIGLFNGYFIARFACRPSW